MTILSLLYEFDHDLTSRFKFPIFLDDTNLIFSFYMGVIITC
jgi:hypothetical protein